jgi:diaminopimelate epimerase
MGMPIIEGRKVPVDADGPVIGQPLEVAGRTWGVTCVSMGNPHCVTFDVDPDSMSEMELQVVGKQFESHPFFPARVNTEFIRVDAPDRLRMRVWERGSGETWACGTGACASVVAGVLTKRCDRRATVVLNGGDLDIEYGTDGCVRMTGPAEEVFTTTIDVALAPMRKRGQCDVRRHLYGSGHAVPQRTRSTSNRCARWCARRPSPAWTASCRAAAPASPRR